MKRLSDLSYTVAAFCADPTVGAKFAMQNFKAGMRAVWLPPDGWGLGGHSFAAEAVVDAVHTDLVNPANGHCLTDAKGLVGCCTPATTCLFINSFRIHSADSTYGACADVIARAIDACPRLEVICLYECYLTSAVIEALIKRGRTLKGIVLDKCYNVGLTCADDCWSRLLAASPALLWLQLSFLYHPPIGPQTWANLPASLHVVLVHNCRTASSSRVPAADKDVFRKAVRALPAIKWAKEDMNDGADCQRAWQYPSSTPTFRAAK